MIAPDKSIPPNLLPAILNPNWDYFGLPDIFSPFIPFNLGYNYGLFYWLINLSVEIEFDDDPESLVIDLDPEILEFEDYCSDVNNVLMMLDATGNLDAPLS